MKKIKSSKKKHKEFKDLTLKEKRKIEEKVIRTEERLEAIEVHNSRYIAVATIIIFTILAISIYSVFRFDLINGKYDSFSKCLTEKEITLSGSIFSNELKEQRNLFGKSFQNLNYKETNSNTIIWKINETNLKGVQSLEKLSEISGCELNNDKKE